MQICTQQEVTQLTSMPSSSDGQNLFLKQQLASKELSLDQCLILMHGDQLVARIIVYLKNNAFSCFTIEDISIQETIGFLKDVLAYVEKKTYRIDLYGDKVHHDIIYEAISSLPSVQLIKRKSYVCKLAAREQIILPAHLTFRNLSETDQETILYLYQASMVETQDQLTKRDIQEHGLNVAASNFYTGFIEGNEHQDFYQSLWLNDTPVGFVACNRLLEEEGGIYHIGVVTSYRGHHYSSLLLQKIAEVAYQHNMRTLVGDIDANNTFIEQRIIEIGYDLYSKVSCFYISL